MHAAYNNVNLFALTFTTHTHTQIINGKFPPAIRQIENVPSQDIVLGSDNTTRKKERTNTTEAIYILNQLVVLPESQHIHPEAIENEMKNK